MTTVLVALLLLSQLSLSSSNINTSYGLYIGDDILEFEESEITDFDDNTDCTLHCSACLPPKLYLITKQFHSYLATIYVDDYIHSGSIRSPPFIN